MSNLRALLCAACLPFCLGIASCTRTSALPTIPPNAVALNPPAAYQLWWQLTEACSGRTGNLNRIAWYVVPSATHLRFNGRSADGYWSNDTIVLADSARLAGALVRHEMLHALTGAAPSKHPREMFLERCGGIVACDEQCIQDAGPPSLPAPAMQAPPESLLVEARTVPVSPSRALFGGAFVLIITARNPSAQRVHVPLQGIGMHGATLGFGFRLKGTGIYLSSDAWQSDVGIADFAPGESKSYAFDLVVQGDLPGVGIPPGPAQVVGRFAGQEMRTPWQFTIMP